MAEPVETESKSYSSNLTHLRRKTVVSVMRAWREVRGTARELMGAEIQPSLPKEDIEPLRKQMLDCLNPKGGELTARAHTAELGHTYLSLNEAGKARFLKLLANDFDIDADKLEDAIKAWQKTSSATEKTKAEAALRQALVSPRSTILRQFTALDRGFKFLVDMRADLLKVTGKDAKLKGLENDLKAILSSWFDIGLLDLVQLTWDSPAALLEKLIAYEAVHEIRSWDDLKNRLDADRRVYAFFHNKMPQEPLIFVQVAFVDGLADNIQKLLDTESPVFAMEKADTAIFYSISNAQGGLSGISFGNFLIKRVVSELAAELKHIKNFATLSPVPGFRAWLDPLLTKGDTSVLQAAELKALRSLKPKAENSAYGLLELLNADWYRDEDHRAALQPILLRLCARYLMEEKKNGRPHDPVASFHLFNGARLERLNWLGDTSKKGMKQSCGIMANYHYRLSKIDDNHEAFVREGQVVVSRGIKALL